jgi:hypothetical protein
MRRDKASKGTGGAADATAANRSAMKLPSTRGAIRILWSGVAMSGEATERRLAALSHIEQVTTTFA